MVKLAKQAGLAILRRPRLKRMARRMLSLFPSISTRVQTMMYDAALNSPARLSSRVQDDADLSPRTVRMLRAIKSAAAREPSP